MNLIPRNFLFDDDLEDFFVTKPSKRGEMKCDIYEKGGRVHIELDVPGFNKEDVKVDLDDGILTIAATKHEDKEEKEKNYYRKERLFGSFKRQFNVGNVKENEIDAKFNNGVLKISFPKEEQKQSKKFITIK